MNEFPDLSLVDREQIATILQRRAKEIAGYSGEHRQSVPASVDLALDLEMKRLRRLAERVNPPKPETEEG